MLKIVQKMTFINDQNGGVKIDENLSLFGGSKSTLKMLKN
jgi:hypothetical protein